MSAFLEKRADVEVNSGTKGRTGVVRPFVESAGRQ
jgi:hypothetical protein